MLADANVPKHLLERFAEIRNAEIRKLAEWVVPKAEGMLTQDQKGLQIENQLKTIYGILEKLREQ